jgi:GNAT superfamily N-acetyltransferase
MTIQAIKGDAYIDDIVELLSLAHPHYPVTVADHREYKRFNEDMYLREWVALSDSGAVCGYATISQNHHEYTEGKYDIELVVTHPYRRKGIGMQLYQSMLAAAAEQNAIGVRCYIDTTDLAGSTWASGQGFERTLVCCDVVLNVGECQIPSVDALAINAIGLGIRVSTFAAEMESDPDAPRKFHALSSEIRRDIPGPDVLEDVPFEQFVKSLESPSRLGDAQFVAIREDEWIAMSTLWRRGADDVLQTGATGVVRSERGKGIAMLLKHYAVHYAKRRGAPQIITDNAEQNTPMRAINKKLGFVALPETWLMEKAL